MLRILFPLTASLVRCGDPLQPVARGIALTIALVAFVSTSSVLSAQGSAAAAPASAVGDVARSPLLSLDSLIARAVASHPTLRAARLRVRAAQARAATAGRLPHAMLM